MIPRWNQTIAFWKIAAPFQLYLQKIRTESRVESDLEEKLSTLEIKEKFRRSKVFRDKICLIMILFYAADVHRAILFFASKW